MGEHDDRLATRAAVQIVLQPFQLVMAQIAEAASLQILHVIQANKMNTVLVEAVVSLVCPLGEALEEGFAILIKYIMLTRDEVAIESGALDDLLGRIKLCGTRQVAYVTRMDQELMWSIASLNVAVTSVLGG